MRKVAQHISIISWESSCTPKPRWRGMLDITRSSCTKNPLFKSLKTRKKKKKTVTSIFFCHNMLPRACNPWTRHLWEPPQSNQNMSFFPWKFIEARAVSLILTQRPYILNYSVKSSLNLEFWLFVICIVF